MSRLNQYHRVEFEHNSKLVVARVYLGTTSARGDDRDEVVSLNVEGVAFLNKAEELIYEELAIEQARSQYA